LYCLLSYLKYAAGGEGTPPPCASSCQIGGSGGWTGERERRVMGRGSSESIFACIVTTRHPVHTCQSVAKLCMSYNNRTHGMEAHLPVDYPGYCHCRTGWQPILSVCCPWLSWSTTVVTSRSHGRARLVEPWALPCGGLEGLGISLQQYCKRCQPRCAPVEELVPQPASIPVALSNST